jgi:hypothetical protein
VLDDDLRRGTGGYSEKEDLINEIFQDEGILKLESKAKGTPKRLGLGTLVKLNNGTNER